MNMPHKTKAAGWGAKAAFKTTYNKAYFKPFNAKAQSRISGDLLPSLSNSMLNFPLSLYFSNGGATDKLMSFFGF